MSATVPVEIAAASLGVHPRTLRLWTQQNLVTQAVPSRGSHPARYDIAELHRWVRECTDGHGTECPVHHDPWSNRECQCVSCHCADLHEPGGPVGACRRCHRPLIVDGKVVR